MSILIFFLSLFIGINIRYSLITSIVELILVFAFLFYKKNRRNIVIATILTLVGVGLSFIRPTFTKERYEGFVTEVRDNYFIFSSSLEKFYVSEKEHNHEIGDYVSITGKKNELDFVILESEFDFKEYLNNKGIYSELLFDSIEVKFSTPFRLNYVKKKFLSNFTNDTSGVISAILFGSSKNSDVVDLSRELHLMRLISSSGIYLSFLYKAINKLLGIFIKKEKKRDLVSTSILLPYLVFSFPKFVVIKFFILKLLFFINKHKLKKRFNYLEIVSISGLFFLLIDCNLARQDGFLLSYFIPITSLFIRDSFKKKEKWKTYLIVLGFVNLAFLPFSIKYYSEISFLSVPLQLLFTPLYIALLLFSLLSFVGIPIYGMINGYTSFINDALIFFSRANLKIHVGLSSNNLILLYEIILFLFIYFFSIRLRPISNPILLTLVVSISLYISPIFSLFKDYVSFINVGQGDSTLIKYNSSTILIDTGGNKYKDIATDVLIPYFKKNRIYDIDLLITTHDDFDHSGAATSLVNNFKVKRYVTSYLDFPIQLDGLTLTNYNIYPELWKEENDSSLVIGFSINDLSYLIMGDAPIKIEKKIISDNKSIPCDILKVGHHGSNTSTSEEFIKYLSPRIGVISCGKNNYYGHPHQQVLSILRKYKVEIRRTDLESTLTF